MFKQLHHLQVTGIAKSEALIPNEEQGGKYQLSRAKMYLKSHH